MNATPKWREFRRSDQEFFYYSVNINDQRTKDQALEKITIEYNKINTDHGYIRKGLYYQPPSLFGGAYFIIKLYVSAILEKDVILFLREFVDYDQATANIESAKQAREEKEFEKQETIRKRKENGIEAYNNVISKGYVSAKVTTKKGDHGLFIVPFGGYRIQAPMYKYIQVFEKVDRKVQFSSFTSSDLYDKKEAMDKMVEAKKISLSSNYASGLKDTFRLT